MCVASSSLLTHHPTFHRLDIPFLVYFVVESMTFRDHYKVLGVTRQASEEEIKTKYRSLVLKLHPDVVGDGSEETKQVFLQVRESFEVLGNEKRREGYDREYDYHMNTSKNPSSSTRARSSSQVYTNEHTFHHSHRQRYYDVSGPRLKDWWSDSIKKHQGGGNSKARYMDREQDMNRDQLYFRDRLERMKAGGGWKIPRNRYLTTLVLRVV